MPEWLKKAFSDLVETGPLEVCISYDDSVVGDDTNLKLLHYEGDTWVDRTSSLDCTNNVICASVTSLSPFTLLVIPSPVIPPIKATQTAVTPNPVPVNTPITLTAILDGWYGTGSNIASPVAAVEYNLGSGQGWLDLVGSFNSPVVNVNETISGFSIPGVYEVCIRGIRIQENNRIPGVQECFLVAVYDPDGGFVTGGGWIASPAGAYVGSPNLTGKATFAFVSKYQKGAKVPTGQTEFQFKVANLNFHSENYDWLVVAGAKAQYKGTGTINGAGNYGFLLTAIDGQLQGGGGVDKFRIKIWDKATGTLIYDNQKVDADGADPVTALGGGSIVIHKEKN